MLGHTGENNLIYSFQMNDLSNTDYLHNLIQIAKFELAKVNDLLRNGEDKTQWRINVRMRSYTCFVEI